MYYPLNYNKVTWVRGHYSPANVKSFNNVTYSYWERDLYQKFISVFDFTIPDEWNGSTRDFFMWCLVRFGYVIVSKNDEFGYFFQPASPKGYNLYYQPTQMVVGNPILHKTFTIGEDCEVLKVTPDYWGLWDIISYYAEKLSTLDVSINTNIINSKFAFVAGARNKADAEALKTVADRINKGETGVIVDKALKPVNPIDGKEEPFFVTTFQDVKGNYILDGLLRERQSILNDFYNTISITTLPYEKAERFVSSEAESKTAESMARMRTIKETIDSSIVNIKKLYPDIKLDFELATFSNQLERGDMNGDSESNTNRNDKLS